MATIRTRRAGFTLIELLVVISLMGVLAALSAGAFMRVRAVQTKKASEATLNKLHSALDNRMKAIGESVKKDRKNNAGYWPSAMTSANNNEDVAEALLLYAKLRNELPMTFAEAKTATTITTAYGSFTIPPRANFAALPTSATPTPEESSACFYAAIRTSAGGGAMTDGEGLEQQSSEFTGAGWTARVFKDSFGTPIAFVRQAYPDEANGLPYVRAGQNRDPFDPTVKLSGLGLMPNAWTNYMFNFPNWAVPSFSAPALNNLKTNYPGARNFVTTLVSAGQDRQFGSPTYDLFGGANNDNLLSYRLRREGSSGD